MKGASAEPCVKTINNPIKSKTKMMGPSHHFLRIRMNAQSSPKMVSLFRSLFNIFIESSIEFKFLFRYFLVGSEFFLLDDETSLHQDIHLRSHEAAPCIRRGADNRLSSNIKGCIDDHRTACLPIKFRN
jgi:hypothetical protein